MTSYNQHITRIKLMMRYYSLRVLAALFVMGSFGCGFLAGAEYGTWAGWTTFITLAVLGIILYKFAEKVRDRSNSKA